MLKILGAVTVVVCCSLLGARSAGRYAQKVRTLRSMVGSLTVARSEICDMLTPMPELLEMLSEGAAPTARSFWQECLRRTRAGESFTESWRKAASGIQYISEDDETAISQLSDALGRYDVVEQRSAITRALEKLDRSLTEAEKERGNYTRVCAAVGIGAGVMLAIILI